MEKYEILKKLVNFNTIKDKENAGILNYIESILLQYGFETEYKNKVLVMTNDKNAKLGLGPITGHEVNEHITIASYEKLVIQYKDLIEKFCLK